MSRRKHHRHYKPERTKEDRMSDEQRRQMEVRRRIEDIKEASRLEDEWGITSENHDEINR